MEKFCHIFLLVWGVFLDFSAQQEACGPGFVLYPSSQKCYSLVVAQTTWDSAMGHCKIAGGILAQIVDADLQAFLANQIRKQNKQTNYSISTGDDYVYNYIIDNGIDVRGQTSIKFQVRACNDAHIALSQDRGVDSQNTYEIVIGGWGGYQSVIRDCKQCEHMDTAIHQVDPIDCNQYNPFWVSWTNNVIKVGTGNDLENNTFLVWNDSSPHDVNYVAFATGWGTTGTWNITRGTFNPGLFWIGGSDIARENNWVWLPSKQKMTFTNWAPNEPDNKKVNHHCALLDLNRGYQWGVDNCVENRNFICETSLTNDGEIVGK